MKPKYYRTELGAQRHAHRVQDCWQNLITRVSREIDLTFRTRYFVEVRHPSANGQWIRCGAFSRKAMCVDPDGRVLGKKSK